MICLAVIQLFRASFNLSSRIKHYSSCLAFLFYDYPNAVTFCWYYCKNPKKETWFKSITGRWLFFTNQIHPWANSMEMGLFPLHWLGWYYMLKYIAGISLWGIHGEKSCQKWRGWHMPLSPLTSFKTIYGFNMLRRITETESTLQCLWVCHQIRIGQ